MNYFRNKVYFWNPQPTWIIIIFLFISFMFSVTVFLVEGIIQGIFSFILWYLLLNTLWWLFKNFKKYLKNKYDPIPINVLIEEEANKDSEKAFLLAIAYNEPGYKNKNYPFNTIKQNFSKAVYWLKKASDSNHPDAMALLGAKYAEGGEGVDRNLDLAKDLLCRAKKIGTNPADMANFALKKYNIDCD